MWRNISARAPSVLLVLLLSYFQFRAWEVFHADNMHELIRSSYGILDGTPHWRAFQNRVFAPYLIEALGWVSSEPFFLFMKACFVVLNVSLYGMVVKLTGSNGRALMAVLGAILMWLFQQHTWCYTWDMAEAVCALFLSWFALQGRFNAWVLLLIVVSLFNKETAASIGVFFIAQGLAKAWVPPAQGGTGKVDLKEVAAGVALTALSIVLTEVLRHALFKSSGLDGIGLDEAHKAFGNHWKLTDNWKFFMEDVRKPSAFMFIVIFYLVAMGSFLMGAFRSRSLNMIGLSAAWLSYAAALLLWGLLVEFRIFQPLMWTLVLLMVCTVQGRPWPDQLRRQPPL
jgi:hypothetical protein